MTEERLESKQCGPEEIDVSSGGFQSLVNDATFRLIVWRV